MNAAQQPFDDIAKITGPPFFALVLYWGLFGVLSTQTYIYYQAFPNDKLSIKSFVYSTYLIEVAQTIMITNTLWGWFVSGYGNVELLNVVGSDWLSVALFEGIIAFMVQTFYAYRIKVISRSNIIPCIIMLMAVASFAGAIAISVDTAVVQSLQLVYKEKSRFFPVLGLWQGAASACDILIAICMTYEIRRASKQTQAFVQAHLSGIIRLTVETGTLTAAVSVVSLVLIYAAEPLPYWQAAMPCLSKLYSNTMMAVVNSRIRFKICSESTTWNERVVEESKISTSTCEAPMVFAERDEETV